LSGHPDCGGKHKRTCYSPLSLLPQRLSSSSAERFPSCGGMRPTINEGARTSGKAKKCCSCRGTGIRRKEKLQHNSLEQFVHPLQVRPSGASSGAGQNLSRAEGKSRHGHPIPFARKPDQRRVTTCGRQVFKRTVDSYFSQWNFALHLDAHIWYMDYSRTQRSIAPVLLGKQPITHR